VEEGTFRQDLYYRLRVVTLKIPPLRERKEDIPMLAQHFVESFCQSQGLPLVRISPDTKEWLKEYRWPGNVRELKNALEAGVVLCKGGEIRHNDLQDLTRLPAVAHAAADSNSLSLEDSERHAILRALEQAGWVQKGAAALLGISRRALNYKIKKYGIDTSSRRPTEN
jgi:DNA-binding NtrC family response regulator